MWTRANHHSRLAKIQQKRSQLRAALLIGKDFSSLVCDQRVERRQRLQSRQILEWLLLHFYLLNTVSRWLILHICCVHQFLEWGPHQELWRVCCHSWLRERRCLEHQSRTCDLCLLSQVTGSRCVLNVW